MGKIFVLLVLFILVISPFVMILWSGKYASKEYNPNPDTNRICPFCGQRETINCCNVC